MKKIIINFLLLNLLFFEVYGQSDTTFWNSQLQGIAKPQSQEGWIIFKEEVSLNPENIFQQHKFCFRLGNDDNMILKRIDEDELGNKHYRYQQTYKGIKIEGAEYIVHSVSTSSCQSANGKIVSNLNINVTPIISEQTALQNALDYFGATQYVWQIDTLSYLYPVAEIVIVNKENKFDCNKNNFCLAYKFKIFSLEQYRKEYVYINSQTGEKIKNIPIILSCNNITGFLKYNGTATITTHERGFPYDDCILKDECRGDGIHTNNNKPIAIVRSLVFKMKFSNKINPI